MGGTGAPTLLELADGYMNRGTAEVLAVNSVGAVKSYILNMSGF
jgi:hypothetical protein